MVLPAEAAKEIVVIITRIITIIAMANESIDYKMKAFGAATAAIIARRRRRR